MSRLISGEIKQRGGIIEEVIAHFITPDYRNSVRLIMA